MDPGDGTLRPAPAHKKGDISLVVFIDKWGFKDAMSYYEPRVAVSVRDEKGKAVEAVQVCAQVGGMGRGLAVRTGSSKTAACWVMSAMIGSGINCAAH